MRRHASTPLTPLGEALALLVEGVAPVPPTAAPLSGAIGLVSSADVFAPADLPAGRVALRDGWAVDSGLVTGASPYGPILLPVAPQWVEAGDPLPEAMDAVLPPEALKGLEVTEEVGARDGLREAAEDVRRGDRLLAAGARIAAVDVLGLVAAKVTSVAVRRPRLLVVATGPADPDALTPTLRAMIEARGASAETVCAPDDAEVVASVLKGAEADAVLVVGGTGFGRSDRSAAGLALAGEVRAHGIALRPGESAACGMVRGRPVLLLPGRPDAAIAVLLTLGTPLIAALAGAVAAPPRRARLAAKIASTIGLSEVVFVRRHEDAILPLGGADLPLRTLLRADGAVLVEPQREGYPEGAEVEILPL